MAEESRISGVCLLIAACRSEPPLNRCSGGQRSALRPITLDVKAVLKYESHDSSNKSVFTGANITNEHTFLSSLFSLLCECVCVWGRVSDVLTEGQHGSKESCSDLTQDYTKHTHHDMRARSGSLSLASEGSRAAVHGLQRVRMKSAHEEKRTSPPT